MKKPVWFRLRDLFTIGLGGLTSLGLLIYALAAGVQGSHAKEGLCLLATVGFCFVAIWSKFAYDRKKWLDQFIWYPRHGFMINPGGYRLPLDVDVLIDKTIDGWAKCHPTAESIVLGGINWVWFDKTLNETTGSLAGRLCKGFVVSGTRSVVVDYDRPEDMLHATAFEHEIGHIIHGIATQQWNQVEHHKFASDHGLK